jgi:hypothetical protein
MTKGLDLGKLAAWQQRMATFQSSGLTVTAFCRREGITPARFYYWARRVRSASTDGRPRRIAKPGQPGENNEVGDPPSIDVFIGSQVRVRLPASQPELVAAVVSSVAAYPINHSSRGAFQRIDLIGSAAAGR